MEYPTYATLDEIRERKAAWDREQAERIRLLSLGIQPERRTNGLSREQCRAYGFKAASARMLARQDCTALARARIAQGLTLREAADAAGCHFNSWYKAENHILVSQETWQRFSDALDVPVADLRA